MIKILEMKVPEHRDIYREALILSIKHKRQEIMI
jgi:hypothetical protein